ncbi:hypothetical protein TomMM35A_16540 [Sphingobium sp. TomMM35A]
MTHLFGFGRFLGAGAVSFALILLVMSLLIRLGSNPSVAYAVALIISLIFNFLCNRFFVFAEKGRSLPKQAGVYLITSLAFRGGEWLVFTVLVSQAGLAPAILAFLVQGVSTCVKYLVYKYQVFHPV